MSLRYWGALAGLLAALGVILLVRSWCGRRPTLADRLAPYLQERPVTSGLLAVPPLHTDGRTVSALLLTAVASVAQVLEGFGSSAQSVRVRLERAGNALTYEQLRLEQLLWAGIGLALTTGLGILLALTRSVNVFALLLLAVLALLAGAAARDWWLTQEVARRQKRIEAQLPDVVELLALVVGSGQSPVAALERVVALGRGDLIAELSVTLADIRSGTVLTTALQHLERRVCCLPVTRLTQAVAVALERGTPLAQVLRAQASDAREARRRALMEEGGRREIAQMLPVVFLLLPITIVFALFPGLIVLRLGL